MERLTIPDKKVEGGWERTVIDPKEVKKYAMTIYWALKKYEDTGLTPDEVNALRERDIKSEEDITKFYYCESEDDYYIGKRVGNFYYARYGETGFEWFMSRYLPWGEHVVKPNTLWKEYTYPSEPKEIPFVKWIEGFIRKYISGKDINVTTNNGWFPVDKYGFPKDEGVYDLTIIDGLEEYVSVRWQFLSGTHLSGTQHYVDGVHYWADNYRGDPINEFLSERVIAWRKKPEPYRPVQDTAGGSKLKKIIFSYLMHDDGWIPVEERLPEKNEYFVETSSDKDFPNGYYKRLEIAYMTDTIEYVHGYYDGYKWMDKYLDTIKNIVAWRIHEPYRPERSNNHDGE